MVLSNKSKEISVKVICYLYIVLFVYAAVNKMLDFDNFQIQLAQSPLLSAFAGTISYAIPVIEILIALLLSSNKTKRFALYAAFALMVMFTTYIIIMIKFSPFTPCSCGGILEKMTWNQHLIFNLVVVFLGGAGISIFPRSIASQQMQRRIIASIFASIIIPVSFLVAAFHLSENMMQKRNNFTRRFPHHPVSLQKIMDLKFNSYYIAAQVDGSIYLGNSTAPLIVTIIDSTLTSKQQLEIQIDPARDKFYSLKLSIQPPYFYLSDGKIPIVYRGLIGQWKATIWTEGSAYFNAFEPMNESKAAFRAVSAKSRDHILGLFYVRNRTQIKVKALLDKQTDGIFDTAGILTYNHEYQKILYTYLYKNQFLVIDDQLDSKNIHNTIDTTTQVRITTKFNPKTKERNLSSPAWTVNNRAKSYHKYLFIHAALMGKYEPKEMWKRASIIDTYNFNNGTYQFSFYLTNIQNQKMSDFLFTNKNAYTINGQYLSCFELTNDFYK